jgi:hypothetical protein
MSAIAPFLLSVDATQNGALLCHHAILSLVCAILAKI